MSIVELSVRLRKLRDGKDGADGKSPFVPVVSPAAISYTAGVEKTIKMSFKIVQGDTSYDVATATPQYGTSQSTPLGVEYSVANKELTFRSTATWEGIITFRLVYNGVTYASAAVVSKVSNGTNGKDGATGPQGDPGPAGLVYRKTEWAAGVEFRNDKLKLESGAPASESQNGDGVWYLDIVTKTDSNGKLKGVWECYSSHTSSAETDPEKESYDGDHSAHWRKFSSLGNQPIYTSLVVAEGAVIGFMQGNQLKIFDLAGNLKAGISAASGDYPIFYANPQKKPTSVALAVCVSSGDISGDPRSQIWLTPSSISAAAGKRLNLRFITTYSDGTTNADSPQYRYNVNNGAEVASGSVSLKYCCTKENAPAEANAQPTSSQPATTLSKPYLWAIVDVGSGASFGRYMIAKRESGTNPLDACYQQREDGSATYGDPDGARILLNAAPSSGLPRMEVYDIEGNPSSVFDGSYIYDKSQIYGGSSAAATLSETTASAGGSPSAGEEGERQEVSESKSATIVCPTAGTLLLQGGELSLDYFCDEFPEGGGEVLTQVFYAKLWLDGHIIAYVNRWRDSGGNGSEAYGSGATSFPQKKMFVSAGSHTLTLEARAWVYGLGYCTASLDGPKTMQFSVDNRQSRYFANGIAIGSATNNYFMAWNDSGGVMNFIARNANHGLKVDADGTSILKDGQWKNLESLFT